MDDRNGNAMIRVWEFIDWVCGIFDLVEFLAFVLQTLFHIGQVVVGLLSILG